MRGKKLSSTCGARTAAAAFALIASAPLEAQEPFETRVDPKLRYFEIERDPMSGLFEAIPDAMRAHRTPVPRGWRVDARGSGGRIHGDWITTTYRQGAVCPVGSILVLATEIDPAVDLVARRVVAGLQSCSLFDRIAYLPATAVLPEGTPRPALFLTLRMKRTLRRDADRRWTMEIGGNLGTQPFGFSSQHSEYDARIEQDAQCKVSVKSFVTTHGADYGSLPRVLADLAATEIVDCLTRGLWDHCQGGSVLPVEDWPREQLAEYEPVPADVARLLDAWTFRGSMRGFAVKNESHWVARRPGGEEAWSQGLEDRLEQLGFRAVQIHWNGFSLPDRPRREFVRSWQSISFREWGRGEKQRDGKAADPGQVSICFRIEEPLLDPGGPVAQVLSDDVARRLSAERLVSLYPLVRLTDFESRLGRLLGGRSGLPAQIYGVRARIAFAEKRLEEARADVLGAVLWGSAGPGPSTMQGLPKSLGITPFEPLPGAKALARAGFREFPLEGIRLEFRPGQRQGFWVPRGDDWTAFCMEWLDGPAPRLRVVSLPMAFRELNLEAPFEPVIFSVGGRALRLRQIRRPMVRASQRVLTIRIEPVD